MNYNTKMKAIKDAKSVVKSFEKYGLTLDEYTIKQYGKLGVWAWHLARK